MGPFEQRLHDEQIERHERLWHPRPAWHAPQVVPAVAPEPIDFELHRLIYEAAAIERTVGLPLRRLPLLSCALIQNTVAKFYGFTRNDLLSDRRRAPLVYARHVAIWLACRLMRSSLPRIGRQFGGRDHTTILHARRSIERNRQTDARLADELQLLTMRICEATGWREEEVS